MMVSPLRLKRLLATVFAVYGFLLLVTILSLPRDFNTFLHHPAPWINISALPAVTRKMTSSHVSSRLSESLPTRTSTKPALSSLVTHTRISTFCPVRVTNRDKANVSDYFKPSPQPVTKIVSTFLIEPPDSFCSGFLDILFLVPSSPDRGHYRNAIRETWGSGHWPFMDLGIQMTVLFLLARPVGVTKTNVSKAVLNEAADYQDILLVDADDGYRQMTVKMLAGLLWLSERCSQVRYVARVDEDHFLNVPLYFHRVHAWFRNSSHGQSAILGKILCSKHSVVIHGKTSKHHVDRSDYPLVYFPTYMGGGTYVMSAELVSRLVNVSVYMKAFTVDDAYITGVLVHVLDVLLVNLPWIVMEESARFFLDHCGLSKHRSDPQTMRTIWQALHQRPFKCKVGPEAPLKTCAQWCPTAGYSWKP